MGCGNAKKDIENKMMIMQLERANIQMERIKNLKLLEDIDGIRRENIPLPDYIERNIPKEKKRLNKRMSAPLIKGGIKIKNINIKTSNIIKKNKKQNEWKIKKNNKTINNEYINNDMFFDKYIIYLRVYVYIGMNISFIF